MNFSGFDWNELIDLHFKVPYIPTGRDVNYKEGKGRNFTEVLEELKLDRILAIIKSWSSQMRKFRGSSKTGMNIFNVLLFCTNVNYINRCTV